MDHRDNFLRAHVRRPTASPGAAHILQNALQANDRQHDAHLRSPLLVHVCLPRAR